jgi:hypothetical protein
MHGHIEYNHATTSTCDARGLRSAVSACESETHVAPAGICAYMHTHCKGGRGEVVLRFCRGHASARNAANAHAHATDQQCKLLLRIHAHTGTLILTDANEGHVGQEDGDGQ